MMTTPEFVIVAVVTVVGIPSAMWNPTAVALVISWIAGEAVYLITGNNLPVEFYLYPDIFVLAVIMAKREFCNLRPYKNTWHQLKCILLERSPADRVVMLVFPAMWILYGMPIHPFFKWYALYFLVLVQFFAAGYEAFTLARRDAEAADKPTGRSGPLMFLTGGEHGRGFS